MSVIVVAAVDTCCKLDKYEEMGMHVWSTIASTTGIDMKTEYTNSIT